MSYVPRDLPPPTVAPGAGPTLEPLPPSSPPRNAHAAQRIVLSLAVAIMGLIDLFSALLSHPPDRLLALRHLVPMDVLDTSRTFTLLAGALLMVTAWGLRRGKRRAFVLAMLLCAISVPVNLLKAFDFEEATVATALLFALGLCGDAFRVKSRELSLAGFRSRALWAVVALALYAAVGSWALETTYGHRLSLSNAFAEAAHDLFGLGDSVTIVPPSVPHAERRVLEWYLRSLPLLSLVLVLGTAFAALQPASHRRRHRAQVGRVADMLHAYGDSTVAAFALDDDVDYFFSRNGRAVLAYRFESDTLLVIGDPIGPAEELRPLLVDFARFCTERDWAFAFFQARPERLPLYRELGWRALHIGEDPVLWADHFRLQGGAVAEARRAVGKAERVGLDTLSFLPSEQALDLAQRDRELFESMREASNEWLQGRSGGEKGFCMGRFEPSRLRASWVMVAWNPSRTRVEGFITWVPIWARRGWALDLMRRRRDAAAGTMELLVTRSVEAARQRGEAMLSLSLSALVDVEKEEEGSTTGADTDRARAFLRRHLARFYDFEGLFRWKSKFDPSFEDRYLVYPAPLALPRVVLALVRAQSSGGLMSYLGGAGGQGLSRAS
jgi:phosphatidylglycerol lysyltransferase